MMRRFLVVGFALLSIVGINRYLDLAAEHAKVTEVAFAAGDIGLENLRQLDKMELLVKEALVGKSRDEMASILKRAAGTNEVHFTKGGMIACPIAIRFDAAGEVSAVLIFPENVPCP